MGGVFDVNLRRRFVTRPLLPGSLWDDKAADIDSWPEIDEDNLDKINAKLLVRATNDNPSASPTWGEWNEFANAIVRGRGFQFKLHAFSTDPAVNVLVDELGVEMELQQRTEQSAMLSSGTGGLNVTFDKAFYAAPSIGITGFNMATGDYFTVTSVTRTGFSIDFKNSGGTSVDRQFTYTAIGYGKEI